LVLCRNMLRLAVFNVVVVAAASHSASNCRRRNVCACVADGQCSRTPETPKGKDCCSGKSHRSTACGWVTLCGPAPKDFNETMLEVVAPAGCVQKDYYCPLLPSGAPDPAKPQCCHGLKCGGFYPPSCVPAFAKKIAEKDSTEIAVKFDGENLQNPYECWSRKSVYDYRSCLLCCVDPASGPHVNCPDKCENHYNAVVLQELAFAEKIADKDSSEIAVKLDEENLQNANECWSRKSVFDYHSCLLCCVDTGPHVNCAAKCQNHYNPVVLQELAFAKKMAEKDSTEIAAKLDEENLQNPYECWSRKSVYDYRSCLLCCVDPASGPHVHCAAKCQNHYNAVVLQEEVGCTAVGQCTKYKHPAQQLCSDCCVPKHGGSICHHTYDCGGIDALEWYRCGPSPMDYESNLTLV